MKKLLLLFLITGCSTSEKMPTVIGYEKDNGTKHNIINGDLNSLEVVKAYFDAYNKGDLQTVVELEHKDVVFYNPNGTMIESSKKHLEVVHQFLNDNPVANWDITWSMSANVNFDDKPTENWVTSGLVIKYGKDKESKTSISRVVDLMILNGKVKKGYIYQRELSASEKSISE